MSKHYGDYDLSTVVYGKFTTYRPSTGASYTLAGSPVLSVYKDASDTQSTTGVTLTADFDGVTGLNHFAVDTSADGTFYSAGSFFHVVITTGTVDSVSVTGSVVASFTLRKDSSLKPTTAGRALDVSAGGEAGLDWANIGSPTTAQGLSGTTIAWNAAWDAEVESEVNDALNTAIPELSAGAPTATPTIRTGIMLPYMTLRNEVTTTASAKTISNDAGAVIATKALSDDGSTYTEEEMA